MELGMIGLGRMGANIVRRLTRAGHHCVGYDLAEAAVAAVEHDGARGARSLEELVGELTRPRAVWIMVPAELVDDTLARLAPLLDADDVVIDGGNSHYRDDAPRAELLGHRGVHYVDVGTSGGVFGLERGYCLMVGGDDEPVARLQPIFEALAPGVATADRTPGRDGEVSTAEQGYLHCGPVGSGHFVKMVHNGIEYGLMAAYAEGLDLIRHAGDYDVAAIAEVWRRGSVVSSWLLDLTAHALSVDPGLDRFEGHVADSGEGRWTVHAAVEHAVPVPVLATALFERFASRGEADFANRILSAMRAEFGGHVET
jgi:6-phosphogluconate dehydrogenase